MFETKDTNYEVVNAIIESASVTLDRGCFLSSWLMLDYGGSHQGFGGYVLGGTPDAAAGRHAEQTNLAAAWLVGCLRAGDVEDFKALVGKSIRVRRKPGWGGDIIGIGHITKDDRWFFPKETFAAMIKEGE